jgi:sigma-B regulation protein RsbU (phosphoserine phosphatase)
VILEVDVSTGECDYANAGHLPPLLFGSAGVEELPVTGPLFGPLPGSHWDTGRVTLEPGQALVAFTDGITEARNAAGEEFGDERLISCIVDADLSDTRTLAEDVMNSVHGFSSERLKDDATLAVIAYTRTGHSSEAPRDDRFNVV